MGAQAALMRAPAPQAKEAASVSSHTGFRREPRERTHEPAAASRTPASFAAIPVFAPGEVALPRIALQRKFAIGAVDDPLEREADHVAEQVMRMPEPVAVTQRSVSRINRKCAACEREEESKPTLQKKAASGPAFQAPHAVESVLNTGGGQPLTAAQQGFFAPRLGRNLTDVRIHTGPQAGASARAVNALAYTVGRDIVFAEGEWQPHTASGLHLLAHELVHVAQQDGLTDSSSGLVVDDGDNALEQDAAHGADAMARGRVWRKRSGGLLSAARPSILQRAVSKVCNPPSVWFALAAATNPLLVPNAIAAAAAFGAIAEFFISRDVTTRLAIAPGNFYTDNPLAGPIDPAYVAFIIGKNPGLSFLQQAAIAASMVARPDVLMHQPPILDFEEVKPNSVAGRAAGRVKVGALGTFYSSFGLPYVAGSAYTPPPPFVVCSLVIGGTPVTVTFEITRNRNGLLVYDICVETDWLLVAELAILAVVLIILILLGRGAVEPVPAPPMPAPAFASNARISEEGAAGAGGGTVGSGYEEAPALQEGSAAPEPDADSTA
jgi:hypothetical protein